MTVTELVSWIDIADIVLGIVFALVGLVVWFFHRRKMYTTHAPFSDRGETTRDSSEADEHIHAIQKRRKR